MFNLPQTYFTLYGEAASVANPINLLLEPRTIAEIMNAGELQVLSAGAASPRWMCGKRCLSIVDDVPTLETILQVGHCRLSERESKLAVSALSRLGKGGAKVPGARVLGLARQDAGAKQPADRLVSGRTIAASDVDQLLPLPAARPACPSFAAMHSHANEVFATAGSSGWWSAWRPGLRSWGCPLFHTSTARLRWGLARGSHGTAWSWHAAGLSV